MVRSLCFHKKSDARRDTPLAGPVSLPPGPSVEASLFLRTGPDKGPLQTLVLRFPGFLGQPRQQTALSYFLFSPLVLQPQHVAVAWWLFSLAAAAAKSRARARSELFRQQQLVELCSPREQRPNFNGKTFFQPHLVGEGENPGTTLGQDAGLASGTLPESTWQSLTAPKAAMIATKAVMIANTKVSDEPWPLAPVGRCQLPTRIGWRQGRRGVTFTLRSL